MATLSSTGSVAGSTSPEKTSISCVRVPSFVAEKVTEPGADVAGVSVIGVVAERDRDGGVAVGAGAGAGDEHRERRRGQGASASVHRCVPPGDRGCQAAVVTGRRSVAGRRPGDRMYSVIGTA